MAATGMSPGDAIAIGRAASAPPLAGAEYWSDGQTALIRADGAAIAGIAADWAAYDCALVSDTGLAPAGTALQVVAFDVPPDWTADVDRWYAEEHIALLMRAPGWLRARRYRVRRTWRGAPYTSIALHDLADVSVMTSPERVEARATPWRATMADLPWFVASGRWLFDRNIAL